MTSTKSGAVAKMLAGYEPIIRRFIARGSSADDFEAEFLAYFKTDANQTRSEEFTVLDGLFADVDEYVGDKSLRAEMGGLDEDQLRQRATAAYNRLFGIARAGTCPNQ